MFVVRVKKETKKRKTKSVKYSDRLRLVFGLGDLGANFTSHVKPWRTLYRGAVTVFPLNLEIPSGFHRVKKFSCLEPKSWILYSTNLGLYHFV